MPVIINKVRGIRSNLNVNPMFPIRGNSSVRAFNIDSMVMKAHW